jgi:hypothetical protein
MAATRRTQEIMEGKYGKRRVPPSGKTVVSCSIAFETFDNFNPWIVPSSRVVLDLLLRKVVVSRHIRVVHVPRQLFPLAMCIPERLA